jgi:antitoxin (DNA-binding transcriptional repressor) of toxin-antitoxin stability system
VIITKHGKPVAKLVPWLEAPVQLIGVLKGRIKIKGDMLSTGVHWDVES